MEFRKQDINKILKRVNGAQDDELRIVVADTLHALIDAYGEIDRLLSELHQIDNFYDENQIKTARNET